MWIKIPLDIMMRVTWKSKDEIENENKQKEEDERKKEKYKKLLSKYWDMIELYTEFSYKNSNWEVDSKFFNELPKKIIDKKFKETKLTSTKLRQYYDMVNWLYQSKIWWENLKSELYIILAKANYDLWRKNIVPEVFVDFLRINIDMVFDNGFSEEKFRVFKKHFETVVAYSKGVLSDK